MTLPDPNGQTQPQAGNDQTDYKAEYTKLAAQIAAGEYVPKTVYVGLQQTHEKSVLAHKADKDSLVALQSEKQNLETTLNTLQGQSTDLQTKFQAAQTDLSTTKTDLERARLIMKQFPGLVELEGEGLLPNVGLDQLPEVLTKFQEKLGALRQTAKEELQTGATIPPAGKAPVTGSSAARDKLNEANALAKLGKMAEYNAAMDEYYKLSQSA